MYQAWLPLVSGVDRIRWPGFRTVEIPVVSAWVLLSRASSKRGHGGGIALSNRLGGELIARVPLRKSTDRQTVLLF